MRRREFITFVASAAAWPRASHADERTYRVGVLWPFPRTSRYAGLLSNTLRPHGFIEGQNLTIDYRGWAAHVDQVAEYATDLVKARMDVISAGGEVAIRAAQQATKTMGVADDMIGSGFVGSMARPSGNITGVSILSTELDGKRQEILIEALPGLHRLAILADSNTTKKTQLDALQVAARSQNVEPSLHSIASPDEIAPAIDAAKAAGAAALNVLASPMFNSNRQLILDRVMALHLPAIYHWPEIAEEGGFAAYGPRFDQVIRELHTRQLVQILRGRKVAVIPVEQPTKFELVINLKTAKALGIAVPSTLVARADEVIE